MAYTHKEILAATIDEIIRRLQFLKGSVTDYAKGKRSELERLVSFIDSMPVAEASCIWHDARKSVPEDGTNQILCIKEDNLAVVTVNRVVNGTTKWAYVDDLLQIGEIPRKLPMISQEEPVSIWHDVCEIPKSGTNILMIRKEEGSDFPPIAGCFRGTNSRLDGRNWGYYNGFCYNEIEPPVKWAYIDDILNLSNVERTVKNWKEEPVSDDFKLFEKEYLEKEGDEILCVYDRHAGLVDGAQWQKLQMIEKACKWLDENAAKYLVDKSVHGVKMTGLDTSFTEDFKKAMED